MFLSKYLYILLLTLRKLKKYEITKKSQKLYRYIPVQVKYYEDNSVHKNAIPYKEGNNKTFWGFTSTSYDREAATKFLGKDCLIEKTIKNGTLFSITGKACGYDISLFSYYYPKEKEVLLEPERKYYIDEVIPENGLIYIRCEMVDSPIFLNDIDKLTKESIFHCYNVKKRIRKEIEYPNENSSEDVVAYPIIDTDIYIVWLDILSDLVNHHIKEVSFL